MSKRKAPSTSTPTATTSVEESSRLAMARAINNMSATTEGFLRAVEEYKKITEAAIMDATQRISTMQQEHDDKERELQAAHKKRKVELDLEFQRDEVKAAEDVLGRINKVSIPKAEYDALRADCAAAKNGLEAAVTAARAEEKDAHKRALSAALCNKDMEHKANVAEITAQNQQLAKQITGLQQTIAEQREEIKAQRALTQSVAEAGKQGAISQTFGKA